MKFAALTLALLLVVGSQAASLQNEQFDMQEQMRSAKATIQTSFDQLKTQLMEALVDNPYQHTVVNSVGVMESRIVEWIDDAFPVATSAYDAAKQVTADLRETITKDIAMLKDDLKPKYENLMVVLNQHLAYYEEQIEAISCEFGAKDQAGMENLKLKLEPVFVKIEENVKETKSAIQPILESVKEKVEKAFGEIKKFADPHVAEFRDQMKDSVVAIQNLNMEDAGNMWEKVKTPITEIGKNVQLLVANIGEIVNPQ